MMVNDNSLVTPIQLIAWGVLLGYIPMMFLENDFVLEFGSRNLRQKDGEDSPRDWT